MKRYGNSSGSLPLLPLSAALRSGFFMIQAFFNVCCVRYPTCFDKKLIGFEYKSHEIIIYIQKMRLL